MKISVLIYTARGDHPYANTDWHCFDPITKTLAAQTFPMSDFELVIVDTQWEKRRDWFTKNPQPFAVKHVPSSPNVWQARGRTGLPSQINRGFVWCDGALVQMGGENNLFPPAFLETAWRIHQRGKLPVAWYAICGQEAGAPHPDCPANFDLLGYTRAHVKEMDHRAKRFVDDKALQGAPCHYQNYFGYSGVPLATALEVNGFDELFDGQWCLFDIDFGSRLDLAGGRMAFDRELYVIEPPVVPSPYVDIGHHAPFKCHYALLLHNRLTRRRVNAQLPPGYAEDVKAKICRGVCDLKVKCAAGAATPGAAARAAAGAGIGESAYYPFCEGDERELAAKWLAEAPVRSLVDEREARRWRAAPYDRGTFTR